MDERVLADGRSQAAEPGLRGPARGATRRLLTLPLLGVLLATGAAACSSDDNSAALGNWAKQVCDGVRGPVAQSQDAMKDTGVVKAGEAPADLQKRLAADLGNLSTANQQIAAAINKAGAPKVDNGAGVQQDAVTELNQAAQGYQDVQKKVAALPTDDQAKFADGLKSIGDQVQQFSQLATGALAKVQTGDLGNAIAKQPGCKSQDTGTAAGGSPAAGE
ncbi:small secreted protein [Kitasatospora sp. LaBMicrA B282]|uniref:small secreted protein n=1 Tax=Kitasatospora sp. LaBMicrA B282 TaxID=3420949 RepID=UPI003D0F7F3B